MPGAPLHAYKNDAGGSGTPFRQLQYKSS
jgi:hypothetical protein